MQLTRKSASDPVAAPRLRRFAAHAGTFDRRTFLKRSGLVAGAGAFAAQLPLGTQPEALRDRVARCEARQQVGIGRASLGSGCDARFQHGTGPTP